MEDDAVATAASARYAILDANRRECLVFEPAETVYIDCTAAVPRRVLGPGPEVLSIAAGRVVFGFRTIVLPGLTPVRLNERFTLERRVAHA